MAVQLNSVTAPIILELIQQHLSETEQRWLNVQLTRQLEKPPLSLEQKLELLDELSGCWADDDNIQAIFQEIEEERAFSRSSAIAFAKHKLRNTNTNGIT